MLLNNRKSKRELKVSGCPICNSRETQKFLQKGDKKLMICKKCRHIFWSKFPTIEELRDYYTYKYYEKHNQVEIQSQEKEYYCRHLEELTSFMNIDPKDATILDYGCSYPVLLIEAKKMGFCKVIGAEYDHDSLVFGENNGINIISPNSIEDSIEDHSVDIIRFSHVLEHLIDPGGILHMIMKKLKFGGLVYITQPNIPVFLLQELKAEIKDAVYPEHLHFFTPVSLKLLVEKSGLVIRKFFTHQNAEDIVRKNILNIDLNLCAYEMLSIANKGDSFFGVYCNYPIYSGENSVMYATLE